MTRGEPLAPADGGSLPVRVGGYLEPDDTQPMSPAELRMVREYLGLTAEWVALHLGVALRTVRRWEHGQAPVPEGVRLTMERLEAVAAEQVGVLVEALSDASEVVLTIPEHDGEMPAAWWRAVAMRTCQEVPGVVVRYP